MIPPGLQVAQQFLPEPGQRAGFVLLGAFLLSFAFIRMSTRLIRNPRVTWWPGNVTTKGGLHLHHLVVGILLTLVCGFLEFVFAPASPWLELLAGGFGVGAGLTLDEFALWVHLEDVYWAEQGRVSLDAILVATLFGGLLVLGLAPFELAHQTTAIASIVAAVVVIVLLSSAAWRRPSESCCSTATTSMRRYPAPGSGTSSGWPRVSSWPGATAGCAEATSPCHGQWRSGDVRELRVVKLSAP